MTHMAGAGSLLSSECSDNLAEDDELRVDNKLCHRHNCAGEIASPGVDLDQTRVEQLPVHPTGVRGNELNSLLLIAQTTVVAVGERKLDERV